MTELLDAVTGLAPFELLLLASDLLVVVLGIAIAAVAYRGYGRNDSRPMLFVAAGFVLTFGGPGAVFVAALVVPMPSAVAGGLTQLSEVAGMLTILYGIRMPARE
ncbi:MAG: hypothetical protein ABEJ40_08645 [Haloarculaceae archaeon]